MSGVSVPSADWLRRPVRFRPLPPWLRFALLAAAVFFVTNLRAYVWLGLPPDVRGLEGLAWTEWLLWMFVLSLCWEDLWVARAGRRFLGALGRQRALMAFLAFSLLSIGWSAFPSATVHRSGVLVFATLAAACFGLRYSLAELRRILYWGCAALIVASALLILLRPLLGTDPNYPYDGAWRGLFWQKNHLGSVVALFVLLYVCSALQGERPGRRDALWGIPVLVVAVVMLGKADSAAAIVVTATLLAAVLLVLGWLRWGGRIRRRGWAALACVGLGAWIVANFESILSLLGRDRTLTGRFGLWSYLLEHIASERPWLGAGFGTIWSQAMFRNLTRRAVGWLYPVVISDNGFLDVLLNLGVVGLALFLLLYFTAWRVCLRRASAARTLEAWFAPLFLGYTLVANLSYSLFFETENLVWFSMVAILVRVTEDEAASAVGAGAARSRSA